MDEERLGSNAQIDETILGVGARSSHYQTVQGITQESLILNPRIAEQFINLIQFLHLGRFHEESGAPISRMLNLSKHG